MTSIGPKDRTELPAPRGAPLGPLRLPRAPARPAPQALKSLAGFAKPAHTRWGRSFENLPRCARSLALAALAALVIGGVPPGAFGAGDRLAGPLPAQVVSVLDGDTLVVRVHIWLGQELSTRVRLAGIDAPELKGKCDRERDLARRARAYLLARLDPATGAGTVRLREVRYGKYAGRVLARVETLDGTDLGQGLVAAGLARPYDGRRRASWCDAAATAGSG